MGQLFKKTPKTCTAGDVRFLFLLCLGRPPHDGDEMAPLLGEKLFSNLKLLLAKAEARRLVVERLELGKLPPHAALDGDALGDLAAGLKKHFKIEAPSKTWHDLLAAAWGAPRFGKAFLSHYSPSRLAGLVEALEPLPTRTDDLPRIEGDIGLLKAQACTGHVINLAAPAEPVTLDFYLNGLYAGSTVAAVPLHQVAQAHGGHAPFAFDHDLVIPRALQGQDRLSLTVFEKSSGLAITGARQLVTYPLFGPDQLTALTQELAALRHASAGQQAVLDKLDQIEETLPRMAHFSSIDPSQYQAYCEVFSMEKPTTPAPSSATIDVLIFDRGDPAGLARSQDSVKQQSYRAHSVTIVGNGSGTAADAFAAAVDDLTGGHLVMLRAGDLLHEHALARLSATIDAHPEAHVLYADYDYYEPGGQQHLNPVFRQRFDADLLLQRPESARAFALGAGVARAAGAFKADSGEAFDFDIFLTLFAEYGDPAFRHVPYALWHFEQEMPDADKREEKRAACQKTCQAFLDKTKTDAVAVPHSDGYGGADEDALRINWPLDASVPKLAIVIPTRDNLALVQPCVESLERTLAQRDETDIIIVDNGSSDAELLAWLQSAERQGSVKIVRADMPFNWSSLNNLGAKATSADYLLFLNDDTLALDHGWDIELRRQLGRGDVGAVGARLLFRNGTIQHAGMVFYDLETARHEGARSDCNIKLALNRTRLVHECSAVTGAFLACRREDFEAVGGFDEGFAITCNDVDFCFKLRAIGRRVLYTPAITFQHFQSESRGTSVESETTANCKKREAALMQAKWADTFEADPYYPASFAKTGRPFSRLALGDKTHS